MTLKSLFLINFEVNDFDMVSNSRVQDWIEATKEHVITIPKSDTLDDVQSLGKTSSNLNSHTMHTPL